MPKLPSFKDNSLLQQALTHGSYINENPSAGEDNERLEFLGDAVLNFLSGEFLFKCYPQMSEGKLTPLRSTLVDQKQLANFAKVLDLGKLMRLGRGAAEREKGSENPSLLSSTFEAIIGAYYLDSGSNIDTVRQFVTPLFESVVEDIVITNNVVFNQSNVDYKSQFQQMALADVTRNPQRQNPEYITDRTGGMDDSPEFTAKVYVNNQVCGQGKGRSKKEAEKGAAEDAIARWNA